MAYTYSAVFIDSALRTCRIDGVFNNTIANFGQAQTQWTATRAALEALTKSALYSFTLSEQTYLNPTPPTNGANNADKVRFTLSDAEGNKVIREIPAPVDTIWAGLAGTANWNIADLGDTLVTAWETAVTKEVAGTNANITDILKGYRATTARKMVG